jgi:hypothetical protein
MPYLDLENIFTYHAPRADQLPRYQELRDAGKAFAQLITDKCPDSRERSLALTRIQEAVQMANAAIAINEK